LRRNDCEFHLNLTDCDWKLHIFGTSKYPFASKCRTVIGLYKKLRVFGSELSGVRIWCLHPPLNYAYFNLSPLIVRLAEVLFLIHLTVA